MTLEIEDIRNISLVLPSVQLLNRADTKEEFEKQVGTEVTDEAQEGMGFFVSIGITQQTSEAPPQTPVPPPPTLRRWRIERDRILLDLLPDRTTIVKEYPKREDIDRFAEVLDIAFQLTDFDDQQNPLRRYGLNIDAACRVTTGERASQFLVNRLYKLNVFQEGGYGVEADLLHLRLRRDEILWRIRMRPRPAGPNDRIDIGLNLQRDADKGGMPAQADLAFWFTQVWEQMESIVELLAKEVLNATG